MRHSLIILPLLLCASPALAQSGAPLPPPGPERIQLPPQLADPATADRLANTVQAISSAVLDLPVGNVQAAIEGRPPTTAERRMTVRDLARRDDPNFDRKLDQRIAQARPMIRHGMQALNEALPQIVGDLQRARKAIERAAANMPDPNYPVR